jgi:hypothetical protein
MSTIITRIGKGTPLTNAEVDANFTNLNTDKIEAADTRTLTNKTISGANNTLSNIGNASLTNSSITFGSTAQALGSTVSALNGVSIGATTPSTGSFTSLTNSGNLAFTGTGNRITGDFSNATVANRVWYQTSTANTSTIFDVVPSGTGVAARGHFYNSSDPSNASVLQVGIQAGGSNAIINSTIAGTGSYLPMTFSTGGSEQVRIDTSGNVGIGQSNPSYLLSLSRNAPTSSGGSTLLQQVRSDTAGNSIFLNLSSQRFAAGSSWDTVRYRLQQVVDSVAMSYIDFNPSSSSQALAFGHGTTEHVRIDSTGRVGIGTNTPTQKLSIQGAGFVGASFNGQSIGDSTAERIRIGYKDGNPDTGLVPAQIVASTSTLQIASRDNADGAISFRAGSGIPERMRILGDGRVAINATAATGYQLTVGGGARIGNTEYNLESIEVGRQGTGDRVAFIDFHASGTPAANDFSTRLIRGAGANGNFEIENLGTGNIVFRAGGGETMRITSGGPVGIGESNPSHLLTVGASSAGGSYMQVRGAGISYLNSANFAGVGTNFIGFGWASPNIYGTVDNAVSMVVGTTSDYRLKTNMQPLTDGLQTVLALRPITYNPVEFDGTVNEDKIELGLIAHEVQAIRPSVVTGEKDAVTEEGKPRYQSVNYAGLVPDLIKAIQEQQQIIEQLKARLDAANL